MIEFPILQRGSMRPTLIHMRRMGYLKRIRRPPRVRPSKMPEIEYYRAILKLLDQLKAETREILMPALPAIVAEFPRQLKVKHDAREILEKKIGDIRVAWARKAPIDRVSRMAGAAAEVANAEQQSRIVRTVLGVRPELHEPWLQPMIGDFARKNAKLITRVAEDFTDRVENRVVSMIQEGARASEIAKGIESDFLMQGIEAQIAERRAALIARDQIGKLQGDITRARQTELGVSRYVWRTSLDERVRGHGKPEDFPGSHEAREGQVFEWEAPMIEQLEEKGLVPASIDGPPGSPINCRCWAEPVLSDLVDDLPEI